MRHWKALALGALAAVHAVGAGVVIWLGQGDPVFAASGLCGISLTWITIASPFVCGAAGLALYSRRWIGWFVTYSVISLLCALLYAAMAFVSVFLSPIGQPHAYTPTNTYIPALYLWPAFLVLAWITSHWIATVGCSPKSGAKNA